MPSDHESPQKITDTLAKADGQVVQNADHTGAEARQGRISVAVTKPPHHDRTIEISTSADAGGNGDRYFGIEVKTGLTFEAGKGFTKNPKLAKQISDAVKEAFKDGVLDAQEAQHLAGMAHTPVQAQPAEKDKKR